MSGEKNGIPWVTIGVGIALAAFYTMWLGHFYTWNGTPLDGAVATFFTGSVPLATIYILVRIGSWVLRKPFKHWSTED